MSFTVQNMIGGVALVSGTDAFGNSGQTQVDTTEWEAIKASERFSTAKADFDAKVEEFFKPLTDAAAAVMVDPTPQDELEYVVLNEGVEPVAGEDAEIVQLSRDSMILRAIETGATDRLVWVDSSTLGILAAS